MEVVYNDTTSKVWNQSLITPSVVNWARNHFNCPRLQHVPLETGGDEGSRGSHWSKFLLGEDILTAASGPNPVISGINFAFLNDTGFYEVDPKQAEFSVYGKGAGCRIYSGKCSDNPMTCKGASLSKCSTDYQGIGICAKSAHFGKGCNFPQIIRSSQDCRVESNNKELAAGQIFGFGSRCIEGQISFMRNGRGLTLSKPYCLKTSCDVENRVATFTFSGQNLTCKRSEKGMTKTFLDRRGGLKFTCPDTNILCHPGLNCPNDCSLKGRCLITGKCRCYNAWKGEDCSVKVPEKERYLPKILVPFKNLKRNASALKWIIILLTFSSLILSLWVMIVKRRFEFATKTLNVILFYQLVTKIVFLNFMKADFFGKALRGVHEADDFFRLGGAQIKSSKFVPEVFEPPRTSVLLLISSILIFIISDNVIHNEKVKKVAMALSLMIFTLKFGNSFFYSLRQICSPDSENHQMWPF